MVAVEEEPQSIAHIINYTLYENPYNARIMGVVPIAPDDPFQKVIDRLTTKEIELFHIHLGRKPDEICSYMPTIYFSPSGEMFTMKASANPRVKKLVLGHSLQFLVDRNFLPILPSGVDLPRVIDFTMKFLGHKTSVESGDEILEFYRYYKTKCDNENPNIFPALIRYVNGLTRLNKDKLKHSAQVDIAGNIFGNLGSEMSVVLGMLQDGEI
jgi:hypothetical protein